MRLIFLDIDGVLNGHEKLPSGYCGIRLENAHHLNTILDAVPDARLVISSAWRYLTFQGHLTLKGFEYLLLVCGVKAHERVIGRTEPDGRIEDEPNHFDTDAWNRAGLKWRRAQIEKWLEGAIADGPSLPYVVLDDLPLGMANFIQTDGTTGLTAGDAQRAIAILTQPQEQAA